MKHRTLKTALLSTAAVIVAAATLTSVGPVAAESVQSSLNQLVKSVNNDAKGKTTVTAAVDALQTKTPIKHLVVIFQENRSFDHYFGTYPNALNVEGEPTFKAAKGTQTDINNLLSNPSLLDNNPNLNPLNTTGATNPFRLDRTQANTADQSHSYGPEQKAYDGGKADLFPLNTGSATSGGAGAFGTKGQVMGYFDGNTVTAFWNYAQNYAMSDNSYGDQYGPSTPGAINMFAGQTNGIIQNSGLANSDGSHTLTGDSDPFGDVCSGSGAVSFAGKNIGDLLNAADIPWGSFVGGFDLTTINANGSTGCSRSTVAQVTGKQGDYVPHHIWFQYYASTANLNHVPPTNVASIGLTNVAGKTKKDPANHAYDLDLFQQAVANGNYPAVSLIKMRSYQDAHPGNSDPLDEQTGIVNLINFLQQQPDWDSTAVIIAYDDSDGWYDHQMAPTTQGSFSSSDALNGTGNCGIPSVTPEPLGLSGQPVAGRCGPGTRQPFLVISPYAKKNYVSHVLTTQASIPQFIEDNWLNGQRIGGGSFDATTGSIMDMFNFKKKNSEKLILDETTGMVDEKASITN
jgi:phospholipase C